MLQWLEQTPVADWVAASAWGYPVTLASHGVGLAIVVGVILMISVRLLGLFGGVPLAGMRGLLPYLWAAFLVNFVSGVGLFVADAERFFLAYTFQLKILFIASGVLMIVVLDRAYLLPLARNGAGARAPLWLRLPSILLVLVLLLIDLLGLWALAASLLGSSSLMTTIFSVLIAATMLGAVVAWVLDLLTPAGKAAARSFYGELPGFLLVVTLVLANLLTLLWLFAVTFPEMALLRNVFALAIVAGTIWLMAAWILGLRKPAEAKGGATVTFLPVLTGLLVLMLVVELGFGLWWLATNAGGLWSGFLGLSIVMKLVFVVFAALAVGLILVLGRLLVALAGLVVGKAGAAAAAAVPQPARQMAIVSIAYWWLAVILSGRLIAYLN